jgi:hypothetical protein
MLLLMADRVIAAANARPLAWGRETGWSHLVEGWLDLLTKLESGGASADAQGFVKAALLQLAERVCPEGDRPEGPIRTLDATRQGSGLPPHRATEAGGVEPILGTREQTS